MMTRRQAIKTTALASAAFATLPSAIAQPAEPSLVSTLISTAPQPFTLPPLPYAYDALEPHIDARTMERTDKKGDKVVATSTRVVSEDGKTMTVTVKGTNAQGQAVDNVTVWEKQ